MLGPLLLMKRFGAVRARAGQPGADHVEHLDGVAGRQCVIDDRDHGVEAGVRRLDHHVAGVVDVIDVIADAAGQVVDAGAVVERTSSVSTPLTVTVTVAVSPPVMV